MNEKNQDQDFDTEAGDEDIRSAEGDENVEEDLDSDKASDDSSESPEEIALRLLNEATGESFKDLNTARKSIKDLKSYTGMKKEDVSKKLEETGEYVKASQLEEMLFFRDNAEYKPFEKTIRAIAKDQGISISEAVKADEFTQLFEAKKEFDDFSSKKTVMESNTRTTQASGHFDTAKKLQESGNVAGVEEEVAKGVLEAVGLK